MSRREGLAGEGRGVKGETSHGRVAKEGVTGGVSEEKSQGRSRREVPQEMIYMKVAGEEAHDAGRESEVTAFRK